MTEAVLAQVAPVAWRQDARIISLVGLAHLTSHFSQLLIAPLFPWLKGEFGLTYAALGFVTTVIFMVSAASQAVAGFVVDRFGAGLTLIGGLACLTLGTAGCGFSTSYSQLLAGAALIGLGNGVFHPVDYSLLNARVSVARLGPAYSVHGVTGSLGWALAPVFVVGIATYAGWRASLFAAALLPALVIALLLSQRDALRLRPRAVDGAQGGDQSLFGFLRLPAVWWCFVFFFIVAAAAGGIQNFAPTIFAHLFEVSRTTAALSITVFMLASALGMLSGGWLVARQAQLERNISFAFACSILGAVCLGLNWTSLGVGWALIALMGFGSGLSGPSRDMLIRASTPRGATGRVYGVVYSGLDFGIALGPVLFGKMLDHGYYQEVFFGIAVCWFCALITAWRVAGLTAPRRSELAH